MDTCSEYFLKLIIVARTIGRPIKYGRVCLKRFSLDRELHVLVRYYLFVVVGPFNVKFTI